MKYIDAELLKSKLKNVATELKTGNYYLDNSEQAVGYENALIDFEQIIDSIQQEQPKVDLEKELDTYYDSPLWDGELVSWMTYTRIARHFYELGLKTK